MKYAVTGSNGYLGRRLVSYLKSKGHDVLALSHARADQAVDQHAYFDLVDGVRTDVLRDCDVLVHCAYDFCCRDWENILETNVRGSQKLLDSARRAGVAKTIVVSSMSAFEGCKSLYGKAKLLIEQGARRSGAAIVRPGLIYDEQAEGMVGALRKMLNISPVLPLIGMGEQKLYLIHCEDLCRFIELLAIAKTPLVDQPMALAYEQPFSLKEILRIMAQAQGRTVLLIPFPSGVIYWGLRGVEAMGLKTRISSDSLLGLLHYDRQISFAQMHQFGFYPRKIFCYHL